MTTSPARTPTPVHLPPHIPFPIRITALLRAPLDPVDRGTDILYYAYTSRGVSGAEKGEEQLGTWECPIEGEVVRWRVGKGDVVRDASKPVVEILEPCRHEEQMNGLCLLCLKDVSYVDYTGFSDTARATVAMVHDAAGITVSQAVAERLEAESHTHLLSSRKLSLVVDLDQTIIHATVDPTVGEWLEQMRAYDRGEQGIRWNPNWEAMKDLVRFKLSEERKVAKGREKQRRRREETWYYVKPRPGLHSFLTRLSRLYELHVYTMGARPYASAVLAALDPTGTFFGSRVLSRDESGSVTIKSLTRLFPCNRGTAVVIDDRADVWEINRGNLVRVVPFHFFPGVEDLNSSFLPPAPPPLAPPSFTPSPPPPTHQPHLPHSRPALLPPSPPAPSNDLIPALNTLADDVLAEQEEQKREKEEEEAREEEARVKREELRGERPLEREWEKVVKASESESGDPSESGEPELKTEADGEDGAQSPDGTVTVNGDAESSPVETAVTLTPSPPAHTPSPSPPVTAHDRPAILNNSDHELERVLRILEEIHGRFYRAHDLFVESGERRKEPSVMEIIPEMKAEVLSGCHIVFSSLIPVDTRPMDHEFWRQALQFGASCYTRIGREVTHVVAAKRGTEKVKQAAARGITIVNPGWFFDSIAAWERKNEADYPLLEPGETAPPPPPPPPPQHLALPEPPKQEDGIITRPPSPPSTNGKNTPLPLEPDADAASNSGDAASDDGMGASTEGFGEDDMWAEMDREVDEALGEEDSDGDEDMEEDGEGGSRAPSVNGSVNGSISSQRGKKRPRSDLSSPPTPTLPPPEDEDGDDAPKAKRRKEDSESAPEPTVPPVPPPGDGEDTDGSDYDDFLARDLAEAEDEDEQDEEAEEEFDEPDREGTE